MKIEENMDKAVVNTVSAAIDSFKEKNGLSNEDINVIVIDPSSKVIIRFINPSMPFTKNCEKTIYHGTGFDIFVFNAITRGSGILEYDNALSLDYRMKCED